MSGTLNRRGKPKGTGLVDGKNERTLRRERAAERQAAREERGPVVQLRTLDRRLGKDVGARRERALLTKGRAA